MGKLGNSDFPMPAIFKPEAILRGGCEMDYFGYIFLSVLFVHKYGKWVHEYFIARSECKAGFFCLVYSACDCAVTGCEFVFTHSDEVHCSQFIVELLCCRHC